MPPPPPPLLHSQRKHTDCDIALPAFSKRHSEYFLPGFDFYAHFSSRDFIVNALSYKPLLYSMLKRYLSTDFLTNPGTSVFLRAHFRFPVCSRGDVQFSPRSRGSWFRRAFFGLYASVHCHLP